MQQNPPTQQSKVNITIGTQTNPSKPTPIDIDFKAYFFKNCSKLDNIKFNLSEFMKRQIPNDTIIIEVESKKGDNQTLAMKIQQQSKKAIESMMKQGLIYQFKVYAPGNTNKLYVLLHGGKMISSLNAQLQKNLQQQQQQLKTQDLNIKIKSQNTWKNVIDIAQQKNSIIKAILDNLYIGFTFTNSQAVKQFALLMLNQQKQGPAKALTTGFSRINMNLKLQSSQTLQRFQEWRIFKQNPDWSDHKSQELTLFEPFKGEFQEKAKIYWFGHPLSLQGNIHINGVQMMLKTINIILMR